VRLIADETVAVPNGLADDFGGSEVEVLNDWKFRGGSGGGSPWTWEEGRGSTGEGVGRLSDELRVLAAVGFREVANRSAMGNEIGSVS